MLSLCSAGLFYVTKDIQQYNGAGHHGHVNDFNDDNHESNHCDNDYHHIIKSDQHFKCSDRYDNHIDESESD